MNHSDIDAIMRGIAPIIKEFTARAIEPLGVRLAEIEHRLAAPLVQSSPPHAETMAILRVLETDVHERISALEERIEALPVPLNGIDGKSLSPDDVAPMIVAEVRKAVDLIPVPKDGAPGAPGPAGKDGVAIAGAVIDREGNLVLTLGNGEHRSLGCIVGRDGARGADGKDGIDAFGFDDLDAEYDGERTITFKFIRGEKVKSFSFLMPIVLHRGPFDSTKTYMQGDQVTFGGSTWIAIRETSDMPLPEKTDAWIMSSRRGGDGKRGKDGLDGKPGPEGRPGRDLTQMTFAGEKY